MWISGLHSVKAFLKHKPEQIKEIFILVSNKSASEVADLARKQGISVQKVNNPQIDKSRILFQGIGANCNQYEYASDHEIESLLTPGGKILILDSIQDPHNFGACIRTADATKVDCIIVAKDKSSPVTEVVARSATGAIATIPIVRVTNLARTIEKLKEMNVWVYGTELDHTATNLYETEFPKQRQVAIVMGSEGAGMRRLVREACDELIFIPMMGTVQSLNVSVATALCLFEMNRQRKE